MHTYRQQGFGGDIAASEITPEPLYRGRRELLKLFGLGAVSIAAGCHSEPSPSAANGEKTPGAADAAAKAGGEVQTTFKDATHYNNYYEFGTSKSDPAQNSGKFHPQP